MIILICYVDNEHLFLMQYLQCDKDQYVHHWHASCLRNNKLEYLVNYKSVFKTEKYRPHINIDKFRCCLAKFRSSSHCLMIEVGRYYNINDMYRTCVNCNACVEDEYHFLIVHCIIVDGVSIYLLIMQTMSALSHCTYMYFSCENDITIRNLAIYLFYAIELY